MINDLWPPQYTVRKSKRAKRLKISITHYKGIEVIIPYYASYKEADALVQTHRPWIEKHLIKFAHSVPLHSVLEPPKQIAFRCIDQLWHIDFHENNKRTRLKQISPFQLNLQGSLHDMAWKEVLIKWLKKQAKLILTPWLNEISHETGLPYHSMNIRGQLSRWGSCSAQKIINLNYKLLFLPAPLVENVLLHELCHTVHLNHSDKFWQLMLHYNKSALIFNKELKKAQYSLPSWLN